MNSKNVIILMVFVFVGLTFTSCKKEGCTKPMATNYDEKAKTDDGSCIIPGCTDPTANNYDPEATESDRSCCKDCTFTILGLTSTPEEFCGVELGVAEDSGWDCD